MDDKPTPMRQTNPAYVIQTEIEWRSTATQLDTPTKEGRVGTAAGASAHPIGQASVQENALLGVQNESESIMQKTHIAKSAAATERREG